MSEAALYAAALIAPVFSIVTLPLRTRIFAERVLWHAGLERRCARVRAIDLPVLDCEDSPAAVLEPLLEQGVWPSPGSCRGHHLGCARLGALVGRPAPGWVPVIEVVAAAVKQVEALLSMSLMTSKRGQWATAAATAAGSAGRLNLKTVFRNARVSRHGRADTELASATVVVEDDRITHVVRSTDAAAGPTRAWRPQAPLDREIDARGQLLMPGLINGHFHSS